MPRGAMADLEFSVIQEVAELASVAEIQEEGTVVFQLAQLAPLLSLIPEAEAEEQLVEDPPSAEEQGAQDF
jgi:hypothetical protein